MSTNTLLNITILLTRLHRTLHRRFFFININLFVKLSFAKSTKVSIRYDLLLDIYYIIYCHRLQLIHEIFSPNKHTS